MEAGVVESAPSLITRAAGLTFDAAARFAVAAIAAATGIVVFVLWVGLQIGGEPVAGALEDVAPALAAMIAAASCALAARRNQGRRRIAWSFIGASALCWGIGASVGGAYELLLGTQPPIPSLADVGYLLAYPAAFVGVMAVPTAPNRTSTRGRAIIDAGIIASALLFISWTLGLGAIYRGSTASSLTLWITHARPFADIVILTILILAVITGTGRTRGRLLLLLFGFTANAASDAAYAILTAGGTYAGSSDLLDTGWVTGYASIALAPLWPIRSRDPMAGDGPAGLLQVSIPLMGLLAVAVTTMIVIATGHKMDTFVTFPGVALGILLTASLLLTHRDSLVLLAKSKRAEAQLQERTALMNQIVGHTPAGLARISPDFLILDPNPRLCSLFRVGPRVMVGSSLTDYIPEADVSKVFGSIPAAGGEIDTVEVDSEAASADGSKLWVHWSATPVRTARGSIDYYIAMFEDITAAHDAESAAMANLASLERLNKLKSEFVTMVSHEFRTALTGIQGFSEVMRDDSVTPDEVKEFAGDINTDAVRLSRMITEMLDLDRMEAGRMKLNLGPVDINELLSDAAGRARVASSKHVVTLQLARAVPPIVGDSDRLFQVVTNLLSNAIKYSPAGGEVVLSSSLEGGNVKISVRDRGPGIPTEFIDKIFGRYERFEGNPKSHVIGTGLGLAIARQIIEMHKGRIWVESTLGTGSVFCFTIPVEAGLVAAPTTPVSKA
jgi:PAS domain S-box-containing protein